MDGQQPLYRGYFLPRFDSICHSFSTEPFRMPAKLHDFRCQGALDMRHTFTALQFVEAKVPIIFPHILNCNFYQPAGTQFMRNEILGNGTDSPRKMITFYVFIEQELIFLWFFVCWEQVYRSFSRRGGGEGSENGAYSEYLHACNIILYVFCAKIMGDRLFVPFIQSLFEREERASTYCTHTCIHIWTTNKLHNKQSDSESSPGAELRGRVG